MKPDRLNALVEMCEPRNVDLWGQQELDVMALLHPGFGVSCDHKVLMGCIDAIHTLAVERDRLRAGIEEIMDTAQTHMGHGVDLASPGVYEDCEKLLIKRDQK